MECLRLFFVKCTFYTVARSFKAKEKYSQQNKETPQQIKKSREMLKMKQNSFQHQNTIKTFGSLKDVLSLGVTNIFQKISHFENQERLTKKAFY